LWAQELGDASANSNAPTQISLTTGGGFSPRLGPNYLAYVSVAGTTESVWKLANGASTELWRGDGAHILGGPAVSPDGRHIAFSARQRGHSYLFVVDSDGTQLRVLTDGLDLQGSPAWTPDGQTISTAANDGGVPRVFQLKLIGGSPVPFLHEYSLDPAWSPDRQMVVYSGPDIGTTFALNAVTPYARMQLIQPFMLTRGARHVVFLSHGRRLVILRGDIAHKDLYVRDLETGVERKLTSLAPDFNIGDFDISPDGHQVVLERVQERSDVVLLEIPRS
jgi:Tol biopolymer transport system component